MSQFNGEVWPPLELPTAQAQPVGVYPAVSALVSPTASTFEAEAQPVAVYPPAGNYVSPTANAPIEIPPQPIGVYPPAGNYVSPTANAPLEADIIPNVVNLPATGPEPVVSAAGNLLTASQTQAELAEYLKVYNQSQQPSTQPANAPGTNNSYFKIYNGPSW